MLAALAPLLWPHRDNPCSIRRQHSESRIRFARNRPASNYILAKSITYARSKRIPHQGLTDTSRATHEEILRSRLGSDPLRGITAQWAATTEGFGCELAASRIAQSSHVSSR